MPQAAATVAVVAAASVGVHMAGQGIDARLVTDGGVIPRQTTFRDTVLEALADATNYRAVRAETTCADCHAEPGGLCHDHAGDFEKADGYGALADQLRQEASR